MADYAALSRPTLASALPFAVFSERLPQLVADNDRQRLGKSVDLAVDLALQPAEPIVEPVETLFRARLKGQQVLVNPLAPDG